MAELYINVKPKQSVKIGKLTAEMRSRLKEGLTAAGAILETQIKEHLSGLGFTRDPARSSPYPGIFHGTLRGSVRFQVAADGLSVKLGPGGAASAYAAIQEFGGTVMQVVSERQHWFLGLTKGIWLKTGSTLRIPIPARPYVAPAWKEKGQQAIDAILKNLMKGI